MEHSKCEAKLDIFGAVTIGPKGQVVIPKDIREKLNLSPGDKLISIVAHGKYLGFIRSEDTYELQKHLKI